MLHAVTQIWIIFDLDLQGLISYLKRHSNLDTIDNHYGKHEYLPLNSVRGARVTSHKTDLKYI